MGVLLVYSGLQISELIRQNLAFVHSFKFKMCIADQGARTVIAEGTDPFSQH